MSTRATYQFTGREYQPTITVYIHHDGYPQGAADYFKDAVLLAKGHGGLAERFVRANDGAEFTRNHDAHGDTEFRYTVALDTHELHAEKRYHDPVRWGTVFRGTLLDFIKEHQGLQLIRYRGEYLDEVQATAMTLAKLAELKRQLENKLTGNASSTADAVWELNQLMEKAWGENEFTLTTRDTIEQADRYFVLAYNWPDLQNISEEDAYQQWVKTFRTPKPTE